MSVVGDMLARGKNAGNSTLTLDQALAGITDINELTGQMYNPTVIGQNIAAQTLRGNELAYYAKWYLNNFVIPAPAGDLREFFDSKATIGLVGLLHAKQNISNGGVYGGTGNQIHTQQIRPITATASGVNGGTTAQQTWNVSSVSAGWATGFFNLDLTKSSTTQDINLKDNVEMVVLGLADYSASSKLFEYQAQENGNKPLGVGSNPLIFSPDDEKIFLFTESYFIPVNTKYTFDLNFSASGASVPVLIGIQYVSDVYYGQE